MSISVHHVEPQWVYTVWGEVEPLLVKSNANGVGLDNIEHLKYEVTAGICILLIGIKDGKITGASTIKFINYPNARVAFITAFGGRFVTGDDEFNQYMNIVKSFGATKIQAWCKDAQTRLFKRLGFDHITNVIERDLESI